MADEDDIAPILPIVRDTPVAPQTEDDEDLMEVRRSVQPTPKSAPLPPKTAEQVHVYSAQGVERDMGHYAKPDPWAKIPTDTYWFGRTWARSPGQDEVRAWEFELVTVDGRNQQDRLLARIDGPFELALDKAKIQWETQMGHDVRAMKILVLSS